MRGAFTWPKLIGSTVGLIGLSGLFSAACAIWPLGFSESFPLRPQNWCALIGGCSLLALSYPLYRGSDWARRVLFVISFSVCLGFTIVLSATAIRRPQIAYDGPSDMIEQRLPDLRLQEYFIQFTRAGERLFPVGLSAFVTLALRHPDVVRAFRGPDSG
jgi:hypothetical protein